MTHDSSRPDPGGNEPDDAVALEFEVIEEDETDQFVSYRITWVTDEDDEQVEESVDLNPLELISVFLRTGDHLDSLTPEQLSAHFTSQLLHSMTQDIERFRGAPDDPFRALVLDWIHDRVEMDFSGLRAELNSCFRIIMDGDLSPT